MSLNHSGPSFHRSSLVLGLLLASAVTALGQEVSPSATVPQVAPVIVPQASILPEPAAPSAVPAAPSATVQAPVVPPVTEPSAAAPEANSVPPAGAAPAVVETVPVAAPAQALEPQAPATADAPVAIAPAVEAPASPAAHGGMAHDLSPEGMFMAADWVVKSVMISLAVASLLTWTVWLAKTLQLVGARSRAKRGLKAVMQARQLKDALAVLENRAGVVASMVRAARHEMVLSDAAIDRAGGDGVKERVASALLRIEVRAGREMAKGTGMLASIGSTAPFVGLFGTVWGIMNSFIGIAETQTTNLAVVAPGIAEALLATAIGLVAAIPAVIIYNVFARSVTGYRQLLADAAAGIERLVSRDLDFRKSALGAAGAKGMAVAAE